MKNRKTTEITDCTEIFFELFLKISSYGMIANMRNFLTDDERSSLKVQYKQERDKRVCDRIKAVLLYDKGWTLMQISDALLLSDEAIRQHIREYKDSKKLKPENGGSIEKLSPDQSGILVKHLMDHTYLYVKDILSYIKQTFGVNYTVSGLQNWLHRNGFSYKKPALLALHLKRIPSPLPKRPLM
jgi:transposase